MSFREDFSLRLITAARVDLTEDRVKCEEAANGFTFSQTPACADSPAPSASTPPHQHGPITRPHTIQVLVTHSAELELKYVERVSERLGVC